MTIDRQTGKIYVYELVPVGEPDEETGEYTEFEERDVTPDDVSRIAAQNAKGVISSIVREAGRQSIYEEFSRPRGRSGHRHRAAGHARLHHHQDPRRRRGRAAALRREAQSRTSATSARPTSTIATTSA